MVKIEIISIVKNEIDNSSMVTFRVSNHYNKNIFLVTDDWFTWNYDGNIIDISFARTGMADGVSVFGYFLPVLKKISPGEFLDRNINLKWPLRLNTIWNRQREVNPDSGNYKLVISAGFGFSEKIENKDALSPENSVLKWQNISKSAEYFLKI